MKVFMAVLMCLGVFCAPASAVTITTPGAGATLDHPTFEGEVAGAADVVLELFPGAAATGQPIGSQQATVHEGRWYAVWSPAPADGQYTLRATQDGDSATATFTLDYARPLPGITAPAQGEVLADPRPIFAGTLTTSPDDDPGVLVDVFPGESDTAVFSAEVLGEDGAWEVMPDDALADGAYTLQVVQYDASGDFDVRSVEFFVDTVAPQVTITAPAGDTNRIRPYLAGTGSAGAGDEQAVLVELFSGTLPEGTPVFSESAPLSGGIWGTSPPDLPEGTYTLRATQSDDAGHAGTALRTFRADRNGPALTVGPAPAPTDRRPTFGGAAGTAEGDASTVHATLTGANGFELDLAVVDGRWSVTTPSELAGGIYTFTVTQRDAAGNTTTHRHSRFRISTPGFVPPPPIADRLGPQITLPSSVRLRRPFVTVKLTVSEPGSAVVSLRIGRTTVKRRVADVLLRQPMTLRLRLTKKQLRRVLKQRRKLTLHVTAKDVFGNGRSVAGKVKLKR